MESALLDKAINLLKSPLVGAFTWPTITIPSLGLSTKLSIAYYPLYIVVFWILSWAAFYYTAILGVLTADQIGAYDTHFAAFYTAVITNILE